MEEDCDLFSAPLFPCVDLYPSLSLSAGEARCFTVERLFRKLVQRCAQSQPASVQQSQSHARSLSGEQHCCQRLQ